MDLSVYTGAQRAVTPSLIIALRLVVNDQDMGAAAGDDLLGAVDHRRHHLAGVLVAAGGDCCQGVDDHQARVRRPTEITGARMS